MAAAATAAGARAAAASARQQPFCRPASCCSTSLACEHRVLVCDDACGHAMCVRPRAVHICMYGVISCRRVTPAPAESGSSHHTASQLAMKLASCAARAARLQSTAAPGCMRNNTACAAENCCNSAARAQPTPGRINSTRPYVAALTQHKERDNQWQACRADAWANGNFKRAARPQHARTRWQRHCFRQPRRNQHGGGTGGLCGWACHLLAGDDLGGLRNSDAGRGGRQSRTLSVQAGHAPAAAAGDS